MSNIEKTSNGLAATPAGASPRGVSKRSKAIAKPVAPAEELRPLQTQPVQELLDAPIQVARQAAEEVDALTTDLAKFVFAQYQHAPGEIARKVAEMAEAGDRPSFRESLSSALSNAKSSLELLRAEYPTTEG